MKSGSLSLLEPSGPHWASNRTPPFTTVIIECISWLINVDDNNYAQWKPEINPVVFTLIEIKTRCTVKHNT
jgi:hypothetical protein